MAKKTAKRPGLKQRHDLAKTTRTYIYRGLIERGQRLYGEMGSSPRAQTRPYSIRGMTRLECIAEARRDGVKAVFVSWSEVATRYA